jgi:hypothetical protein
MGMYGCVWFLLICMDVYGCVWFSMDVYVCMDVYGYLNMCISGICPAPAPEGPERGDGRYVWICMDV